MNQELAASGADAARLCQMTRRCTGRRRSPALPAFRDINASAGNAVGQAWHAAGYDMVTGLGSSERRQSGAAPSCWSRPAHGRGEPDETAHWYDGSRCCRQERCDAAPGASRARVFRATLRPAGCWASRCATTAPRGRRTKPIADALDLRLPAGLRRPPNAVPVANLPGFVAPGDAFSVNYPAPGAAWSPHRTTVSPQGSPEAAAESSRLFSEPANGRVARQVVRALIDKGTRTPTSPAGSAHVGYQCGYGVVADFQPTGVSANYRLRVIIVAAVKNDLALIAVAEDPSSEFLATSGPDRRRGPTSRWRSTWASTSRVSGGGRPSPLKRRPKLRLAR
jgi:hypothetical protein